MKFASGRCPSVSAWKSGMPSASQPTSSASMMQGGRPRRAFRMTAKRPEMSLPVAAEDEGVGTGAVELSTPTVVLDLVQPLGTEGRRLL